MKDRTPTHGRRRRLLVIVAALLCVAGLIGVGAFASFTSTVSVASGSTASGTQTLTVPASGATNRISVAPGPIAPGDTIDRVVDLTSGGTLSAPSVTLTTTAAPGTTLLATDATNGLQMQIDKCSVAWTESGVAPAYTYTCGGTPSAVLASRAVIGSSLALSSLTVTTTGNTDHLKIKLTFPAGAGNTFQGLTEVVTYAFTGTQRAAGAQ